MFLGTVHSFDAKRFWKIGSNIEPCGITTEITGRNLILVSMSHISLQGT